MLGTVLCAGRGDAGSGTFMLPLPLAVTRSAGTTNGGRVLADSKPRCF
jgi:hypothetical protein